VSRFFFADNESTDGTTQYLLEQPDCHVFTTAGAYFVENVEPPSWTNALANTFCHGHWCITVDADELLVFPHSDTIGLTEFCDYLDQQGEEAVFCPMIDMYGARPLAAATYTAGDAFEIICPYFDAKPGWIKWVSGACPPKQMFGGVRERVFWKGPGTDALPPCISKVPLVKWRRGMAYLHSMHFHSGARLSKVEGALLHFKFLVAVAERSKQSVTDNVGVSEKGLTEREAYLRALAKRPDLSLLSSVSERYRGPSQLVELGWMHTTPEYEAWVLETRARTKAA
jgi:hypothetical protein